MTKETMPGTENPFGLEKKEEELASTLEVLRHLEDYCQLVNEFVQNIKLPKDKHGAERLTFQTSDEHLIGLRLGSRDYSYVIEDKHQKEDGTSEWLSYEVNPESEHPRGNKKGFLLYDYKRDGRIIRTCFDFNYRQGSLYPENVPSEYKSLPTLKIDRQGLHVPSAQQDEWDDAWRNFQKKLAENKKFRDFLLRIHYDQNIGQADREWAYDFLIGGVRVEDAEKFLKDVRDYWRAATETELKEKDIASLSSKKRPGNYIIPHQEVRDTVREIQTRLQATIREIDHHQNPRQSPYRTSARNQLNQD